MNASAGTSLFKPEYWIPDVNTVGMISLVIKLNLQRITQFTMMVKRRKLYLVKSPTFSEWLDYHASNCISHQRIYDTDALE